MITGASSGIGAALAKSYAAPGVRLALTGRSTERLASVAAACRAQGAETRTGILDVRDHDALGNWIREIDRDTPVDLVIANAGITGGNAPGRPFETGDAARHLIQTNLIGAVNAVAPLIEPMRARRQGQIALISSLAGLRGLPYSPAYCASKAGMRAYGQALRSALRRDGVAVTVVCPGFVETPLDDSITGPKTFRIGVDRAARIIQKALRKGRPEVAFPLPLWLGTILLRLLPDRLGDRFLAGVRVSVPAPDPGDANPSPAAKPRSASGAAAK